MNRQKIILKNVSLGVFYKILNMGIVFTTIPILLNYLEKEEYGIWVTIFSLVNIVLFVDGGIGNGLKTKLSEALSLRDLKLAKTYISTAYISVFIISFLVLIIGCSLILLIDLKSLLNTNLSEKVLKTVFLFTLTMVVFGFVLNLYKSFYYASQKSSKVELSLLIYQILILCSIVLLLNFFPRNLLFVALTYGLSNILVAIIFTISFFKKNKEMQPSIEAFNKEKVKELMGLSLTFFCIQLCMIVIFTTDNLIISKLLGPEEVTNYDIVYKLFQVIVTITVIAQDPFWALYTDAYQKKDFEWIKKTLKRMNKLFLILIVLVGLLFLISKPFIKIWLQRDLSIQNRLLVFMSIFILIRVYSTIYMNFLNSIGKIKLQMWLYVIGAFINIPVSVFLVKQFNLGSSGVILGTLISIFSLSLILPIQSYNILRESKN